MPGDPIYLPPLDPYRASYAGTVLDQAADGTLHITCDDPTVGNDLRNIPLRVGLPGCTVTVPNGTRLRVLFESASPKGCYAAPMDQDPAATKALALKDDKLVCGTISGMVTITALNTATPVLLTYAGPFSSASGAESADLTGKIDSPCHKYVKGVPNA